ncbi:hypothetical protein KKC91_06845 [bacterium]|nr:hypothetical protein [bacterium]
MKIAKTAPGALKTLWKEKIFLKPKNFNDVKAELEKRGYNFTDYNLGMALKNAKFLTKKGKKGNYTYVQKHPYIEEEENVKRKQNK